MLTAKENMREVILGGSPDRFVNQYEALNFLPHPNMLREVMPKRGETDKVNGWGVTYSYPEGVPGAFPVHTPDKIVVKDMEDWKTYVHGPSLKFPEEVWDQCKAIYDSADPRAFKTAFVAPGMFEQCHHLLSIEEALMNYLLYPEEMADLIKYLTDWELELAEGICSHLHPEALFHHDDWGSELNSFLRPEVFEEFFLEPYRQVYGYYHDHGVEFVIHHSDSYCANLLPTMIGMGIDVWQGCMKSNNVPELIKTYGGQISFMGEIDNKQVDFTGWTEADAETAAVTAMERCGNKYFIPCITQGGPGSLYPGAYKALWDSIDRYNCEKFGLSQEEIEASRIPINIMF